MALQRDGRSATVGGSSTDDAALLKAVTEGPMAALDTLVAQHRKSHVKLIQAMQEAETRHSKVIQTDFYSAIFLIPPSAFSSPSLPIPFRWGSHRYLVLNPFFLFETGKVHAGCYYSDCKASCETKKFVQE